jgi:hypothetical protein
MGFHANPRATTSSPILFRPQWSTGVHRVTDVSPLVIPQMIPQPTIIENGTDPITFPPVGNEADLAGSS